MNETFLPGTTVIAVVYKAMNAMLLYFLSPGENVIWGWLRKPHLF